MMRNLILGLVFVLVSLINVNSAFGQWDFNNETIVSYTSYDEFYGTWDNSQELSVGYKVWDLKSNDGRYTAVVTDNDTYNGTITIKYVTYSNNHYPIYKHSLDGGNTYTDCVGDESAGNYGYTYTFTYENSTELTYTYNEVKTIYFREGSSTDWFIEINFNTDTIANDILTYNFPGITKSSEINATNHEIEVEVENGTDLTNLTATYTLSYGATTNISGTAQESGITENDFSSDVIYSVVAENGNVQEWTIKVSAEKSDENDIITYVFPGNSLNTDIDATNHEIEVEVANGTDSTNLVAYFILSDSATAYVSGTEQESNITANDFSNGDVIYEVVAENGDVQEWTIKVTVHTDIFNIIVEETKEINNVYPNPCVNTLNVSGLDNKDFVNIYDLSGKLVLKTNEKTDIDVSSLSSGVYIVNGKRVVKR